MPGNESHGKGNFWHSFDYGLAHFIAFDGETDYANSPESNFLTDTSGRNATPIPAETFANNAGPFGFIEGWGNNTFNNSAYEQYQWMKADLAAVNRTKTPWIIASSHRPMYSTAKASYQVAMRDAFEALFLEYGVDLYVSGHVHWVC
jgi:predicted MPP superfamily phosphohydrolase